MSVEKIKKQILDLAIRIDGSGGNPYQSGYREDFLKIFKDAYNKGLVDDNSPEKITADNVIAYLEENHPEKLDDNQFIEICKDLGKSWDEWRYLKNNFDKL